MWFHPLGGTASVCVPPCASAVFSSLDNPDFPPDIRWFIIFVFDRPVHGEVVGIHVLDFSAMHGGVALVVEEGAICLRHCCRVVVVPFKEVIP